MRISFTVRSATGIAAMLFLVAGCTFNAVPNVTPTAISLATDDAPATASPTTVPTVAPTATDVQLPTSTPFVAPTSTPLPPTNTPTPTETPGPFLHTISNNETLGFIIQQYGHDYSNAAINSVVSANDNILNADTLPPPGTIILVPRPTIQPTPTIADGENSTSLITIAEQPTRNATGDFTTVHVVQEGESLIDVAQQYSTTLEIISQLNPDIGFFGCNFNNPSGGPDCIITINIGQEVLVPAPTPTPTLSPTPSGAETATPTPTYMPPLVVSPLDGGTASAERVRLQWVGAGVLSSDEVYLVYIKNLSNNTEQVSAFITRENTFTIPAELAPSPGSPQEYQWWVAIGAANASGQYANISGEPEINTFVWGR